MSMPSFALRTREILNGGVSRSILLSGNITDLFPVDSPTDRKRTYHQIIPYHMKMYGGLENFILVVWEQNGPIRIVTPGARALITDAWRTATGPNKIDALMSGENPTVTLEVLRQLCVLSRSKRPDGSPYLSKQLLIVIDGADLILPRSPIAHLSDGALRRIMIMRDWIADPDFQSAYDFLILVGESRSSMSEEITKNPYLVEVGIGLPTTSERKEFLEWCNATAEKKVKFEGGIASFAKVSAGLSLQTLHQLIKRATAAKSKLGPDDVIAAVEEQAKMQLGEGILEFKRPSHRLADVCGNSRIKQFIADVLIPRIKKGGKGAPSGICVVGPIGAGKTYTFEAMASEIGIAVVILKSIRSMWFGDTDVIFERLERFLRAFDQVLVFVDEIDTQFGGIGPQVHETERRLTGRFNNLISSVANRGKIIVLGLTARVHLLPPDLLRAGRLGDFIIPVLDPSSEDRKEFVAWMLKPSGITAPSAGFMDQIGNIIAGAYAGLFEAYRQELKAQREFKGEDLTEEEVIKALREILPLSTIGPTRERQRLEAIRHTTRMSLLDPKDLEVRKDAVVLIRKLELEGITGY